MRTIGRLVLAAALLGGAGSARAQAPKPVTPDLARLTDGRSAQVFNRALTVATESGRAVARLDARTGDGGVLLDGIELGEGVIEVDLKGRDVAQKSFLGIAFHVVDWTTLDAVYFRPFNFRAAELERRSHSVQYVSHPAHTWQRLRAERPGQFEQAIGPPPDPNGWFHARIVLAGGRVEVYVNGSEKPSLAVEDLGAAKSGGVALFVGNGSDGAFADLRITATAPAGPPPAKPLVLHVAPDGDDRWSGRQAEPSASRTDGPLATPQRARDVLRERRRAEGLSGAAEVRLHGGRYRLAEPLVFAPEDSGPTTWAAAPGATPVLSGAVSIDGWRKETLRGLPVWTADASALLRAHGPFRSLFVNGERRARPRLPKEGYWRIESVPGRALGGDHWKTIFDGSDAFVAAPGTVAPWRNVADAEAVVLHFWIEERLPLTSVDPATRLVRTGRKTLMALVDEKGDAFPRYWVENVLEALAPGEWYLDRPSARLTYAPRPGERPETTLVEVPVLTSLLRLEGEPEKERFVEGLRFEGLSFEHAAVPAAEPAVQAAWTTPGTLILRGARSVSIEDGRIAGVGGYAVEIGPGCRDVRVVGNEITDLGAGGVKVDGADASGDPRLRTTAVALTDNHVHAIGRVFPSAIGVLVRHAADVRIAHNHIHDTYYTAISAGWVWGYGPSVTNSVRIERNRIHDVGQGVLSDMGGVYMLGIQPGSVIRGNLVHGVKAAGYGGWAIYPDEGSSHLVIEDNVAHDTTGHVFHQHFGNENTVRNNVFAFGGEGVLALSRGPAHNGGRGALAFTLERNVLVSDGKPVIATGLSGGGADAATRPFLSDLNLFWDVSGAPVALGDGRGAGTGGLRKAYDLAGWRALGLDRHSVAADPRFQDTAARDLRLGPDSPALALGFRPIDLSDVGPRPRGKRD